MFALHPRAYILLSRCFFISTPKISFLPKNIVQTSSVPHCLIGHRKLFTGHIDARIWLIVLWLGYFITWQTADYGIDRGPRGDDFLSNSSRCTYHNIIYLYCTCTTILLLILVSFFFSWRAGRWRVEVIFTYARNDDDIVMRSYVR